MHLFQKAFKLKRKKKKTEIFVHTVISSLWDDIKIFCDKYLYIYSSVPFLHQITFNIFSFKMSDAFTYLSLISVFQLGLIHVHNSPVMHYTYHCWLLELVNLIQLKKRIQLYTSHLNKLLKLLPSINLFKEKWVKCLKTLKLHFTIQLKESYSDKQWNLDSYLCIFCQRWKVCSKSYCLQLQ